jgi:serine/threonine-protein kinase RsbW
LSEASGASKRLRFELAGGSDEISSCVEEIASFLEDAGCSGANAQQLAVVAEELLTNILREAWGDGEQGHCSIDVETIPMPGGVGVSMRTEDDGVPFDPTAAETPDLDAPLEERSTGGLGIHLVKSFTDSQAYQRREGRNIFEVSKMCVSARPRA